MFSNRLWALNKWLHPCTVWLPHIITCNISLLYIHVPVTQFRDNMPAFQYNTVYTFCTPHQFSPQITIMSKSRIAVTCLGYISADGTPYPYVSWFPQAQGQLQAKSIFIYAEGKVPTVSEPSPINMSNATLAANFNSAMEKHIKWAKQGGIARSIIQELIAKDQDSTISGLSILKLVWDVIAAAHHATDSGVAAYYIEFGMFEKKYIGWWAYLIDFLFQLDIGMM